MQKVKKKNYLFRDTPDPSYAHSFQKKRVIEKKQKP